jgi:tight adherence protein B
VRSDAFTGHFGAVLLAAGVCGAAWIAWGKPERGIQVLARRYAHALDRDLGFLRLRLRGWHLATAQAVAAGALLVLAVTFRHAALAVGTVPLLIGPRFWLDRRRSARTQQIEDQLAGWLVSVSGALRAGNSLGEALAASVEVTRPPIAEEFDLVMREYRLGVPLDDALERMGARIESRTLRSAVLVLTMARATGGDVPATLDRAAASLREMARLAGVVRTKTAEGKAQALVISIIPAPLVGLIEAMSADYFAPLVQARTGHLILGAAAALWIVAIAAASRIVAVEV